METSFMSIQWKKTALITTMIFTLSSFSAFAQQGPGMKSGMRSPEMMKQRCETMMKELGVTPEQKQKLDAIMQESMTQAEPVMKSIREKKKALMQYMMTSQATKEQALCMAKEINDLKYQLEQIRINSMFEAKCVLTPEQQQKFIELHQKKMMKFKQKPSGMMPSHG
jgi:Spy/CpxP family protein refolding chaperone